MRSAISGVVAVGISGISYDAPSCQEENKRFWSFFDLFLQHYDIVG